MKKSPDEGEHPPEEIARLRDEAIKRMFKTPPRPHQPLRDKTVSGQSPKGKRGS